MHGIDQGGGESSCDLPVAGSVKEKVAWWHARSRGATKCDAIIHDHNLELEIHTLPNTRFSQNFEPTDMEGCVGIFSSDQDPGCNNHLLMTTHTGKWTETQSENFFSPSNKLSIEESDQTTREDAASYDIGSAVFSPTTALSSIAFSEGFFVGVDEELDILHGRTKHTVDVRGQRSDEEEIVFELESKDSISFFENDFDTFQSECNESPSARKVGQESFFQNECLSPHSSDTWIVRIASRARKSFIQRLPIRSFTSKTI